MEITVLFFGEAAEISQNKTIQLTDIHSLIDLKNYLFSNYPKLKNNQYQFALNHKMITAKNIAFKNQDIVALLPPFSGG
jgi:molybdopterin converting factor small subunit